MILVLNSGSSSLKFGVYRRGTADAEMVLEGSADGIGRDGGSLKMRAAEGESLLEQEHVLETQPEALKKIAGALGEHLKQAPEAVAHRVVHGGPKLREHQRITPEVLEEMKAVKTSKELAMLRTASAVASDGFAAASASISASRMSNSGTRACACATAIPGLSPAARAASSAA